jgi:undecaprenyl-diphosphatase
MVRRRARDVAGLALGVSVLVASGSLARRAVTDIEAEVFHRVNRLPDRACRLIWLPMQYGTFGTAPALGAVALLARRPRLAVALGAGGTLAWLLAKAVKPMVDRGRPKSVVDDVRLRGQEEGDLGFPSGHAAVSAALTVVVLPSLARRWRPLPVALAVVVPLARWYVGAHLPLDTIGGSALGTAIGSAINLVLGVPEP